MKNIAPFKIICIGLPVILIVMVLLFSKGSDAKKERLESQLQTIWHSSEEGEYNEITLAEDGTYSASGAISGTGSYRIDRNNKWIILTAENGKKNVLYYTTGKGNKVESLSMKLTVGTSTMVPGPMPEPQVDEDGIPAISQSEYDLFAATAVATMLTTRGWTCSQGSFIFQNNTIYINGKASFGAMLSEASITDDGQYAFTMTGTDGTIYAGEITCITNEEEEVVGYEMTISSSSETIISAKYDGYIVVRQPA